MKSPIMCISCAATAIWIMPISAADLFRQQSPGLKSEWSDSDTDVYEPTQWDRQRVPTDNDQVQMAAYTANKRFYLSENHTNNFAILYFKTGHTAADSEAGTTLSFDTEGHELLMPSSAAEVSRQLSWIAYVPADKALSQGERTVASLTRGNASTNAVVKMTDFAFRQHTGRDYSTTLDFTRGEFNAFNPELPTAGEADSANVYTLKFGAPDMTSRITVAEDVVFKVPRFEINAGPVTTVFNGSEMHANGSFTQRGTTFATNGALIRVGYLGNIAGKFSQNAGAFLLSGGTSKLQAKGALEVHGGAFTNESGTVSCGGNFVNNAQYVQFRGSTTSSGYYVSGVGSFLRLVDGTMNIASTYGVYTANGTVRVEGGTLTTTRFRDSGGAGAELNLVQTGGTITISGGNVQGIWMCEGGNDTFNIELRGGVLNTPVIYGVKTAKQGFAGTATLLADGGRIAATAASPYSTGGNYKNCPLLSGLDSVTVGDAGLVIDSKGYAVSVDQDIGNISGEQGVLVKAGNGTLSYTGVCNVSTLVVEGGSFKVAGAGSEVNSAVVVRNGAEFSLVGAADSVSVDSLSLTNATIALDPGDVITVNGALSVCNASLSWSSAPSDFQDFLVVSGPLSSDVQKSLRDLYLAGSSDAHLEFAFAYDGETGKMTVRAKVVANAAVSGEALWTGSGAWSSAGNWKDSSAPTASATAVFGAEGAGSAVTVSDGDTAGALSFTNGSYSVSGSGVLEIAGASGNAAIDVAAGDHSMSCGLRLFADTPVSLASGTSLTLDGGVSGVGISKTGLGLLSLGGVLSLRDGLAVRGGMVKSTGSASLGSTSADKLTLVSGTLKVDAANGAETSVPSQTRLSTAADQNSFVFNTATDVSFKDFSSTQGFLVKRGQGTMTIEAGAGKTVTICQSATQIGVGDISAASEGINFPDDGSGPSGMRAPLSIVEGTLRLVGTGANAAFSFLGASYVTVPTPHAVAAQPRLEVDNAKLTCVRLQNGFCLGKSAYKATSSSICAVNGASISWVYAQPGYACTVSGKHTYFAATNSTFTFSGGASDNYLTRGRLDNTSKTEVLVYYLLNNSDFFVGTSKVLDGSIYIDLDNGSYFGRNSDKVLTTAFTYSTASRVYGEIFTRNGSKLALSSIPDSSGQARDLTLAFDGGEWQWSDDNGTKTIAAPTYNHIKYVMRGRGVVLKPVEGATLTVNASFTGDGGIVVDGPGTVAFGSGAYAFDGTADVKQGTLDLSAAGTLSDKSFSGDGEVLGGNLSNARIRLALSDAFENTNGTPVFADCAFSGSVAVETGRTDEDPLELTVARSPIRVAKVSGTTVANLRSWRLSRTGLKHARGSFSKEGDSIYLSMTAAGAIFVVR